jgi:hypothetical protein
MFPACYRARIGAPLARQDTSALAERNHYLVEY